MTKLELVEALAQKCGLTKKKAGEVLDAFCEIVKDRLAKGEEVRIIGFGTWKVVETKEKTVTNPKTKEKMKIPAKKVVRFVRGKDLKIS